MGASRVFAASFGLFSGLLSLAACSAPDPGQVTYSQRTKGAGGEVSSAGGDGPAASSTTGGDGGAATSTGSGTAGGTATGDPVFGTTAFAAGSPGRGVRAKAANPAHGGDASGKNCIMSGCHLDGWAFGGTLYSEAAGTMGVPGAEVRVTGPDGKLFANTFSDVDGNFWIDFVAPGIPAGSRVGVRTADGKKMNMGGAIGTAQAGCSQGAGCHGGTAGKVYIK